MFHLFYLLLFPYSNLYNNSTIIFLRFRTTNYLLVQSKWFLLMPERISFQLFKYDMQNLDLKKNPQVAEVKNSQGS